jgi:hypothetical protein
LCLVILLPSCILGQQPGAESNQAQVQKPTDKRTIKTKVRVVLLDVVVTDAKSRPLNGFRQRDFSVLEDGKLQQIVSFEPHTAALELANQIVTGRPALPPNVFLNAPGPRDALPPIFFCTIC